MNEEEARDVVRGIVGGQGFDRLEQMVALVLAENERQNLIARSTTAAIWVRHVLDSTQLLNLVGDRVGVWLDIGTGGGFPGLAIAAASLQPMLLCEPRRRRAEFLQQAVDELGLTGVTVLQHRVEVISEMATIISARAVAPIGKLFASASQCADAATRWLLPRGERYEADLAAMQMQWQGVFHVEQSLSDPAAGIVVADRVSPR